MIRKKLPFIETGDDEVFLKISFSNEILWQKSREIKDISRIDTSYLNDKDALCV